nr:retrovirus-related Pol polyprotein from transposon TNT 1-94 [Tanacetum cinerariifolium]
VLVVMPRFKTPYELFKGRLPALSFMRPFGGHVTILNTLNQLGKFDGKSDEGIFVGYSTISKAFRVYNIMTRKVKENLHITFLEKKPMIAGGGPEWLFDIDALSKSMNYAPVLACINSNDFAGKGESFDAGQSSMEAGPRQDYILMPLWIDNSLFNSSLQASDGSNKDKHVNTVTSPYAAYPNDPLMHDLEDARIFDDAYDDRDEGAEADYNNLKITKIHMDNKSAVCVVNNPVYHSKTKHIKIRHKFIRDSYEKRLIELVKIRIDYNVADLLTKAFDLTRFQFLIQALVCLILREWIKGRLNKKELAIPGQTATGKELSNLLMAGSLLKTTLPTQLMKVNAVRHTYYCQKKVNAAKHKLTTADFAKTHNLIAFLEKPSENDGFKKIVDFLNANQIKCALTLQALINGNKFVITEASIRHDLQLNDAEGTLCLPNAMIFEELARWGIYVNPSLTKKVFANMKRVGTRTHPFLMHHHPLNPKENTSLGGRKGRKGRKETEVSPTELHTQDHVPTPSNDPLPSGEDSMPLKELMVLCTNLSNKVLDMENKVTEVKSSHKANIAELESRVEKLEEANREEIADIDAYAKVNLENVYNLDMAHEETVLSMQDVIDADGKEVAKEMVEVITTAKIIVDEVSTASGELNAANEEPVSAAPTNISTAQPSKAKKSTVDIPTAPKAKGIVFYDIEESTKRTVSSKPQVKDKGKPKLVEEPKVLKSRKAQIAIDEEVARRIEADWNADMKDNIDWNKVVEQVQSRQFDAEGLEIDVERIKDSRKRTRKEKVEKDQTTKKQKGDELEKDNVEKKSWKNNRKLKSLKGIGDST